MKIIFRPVYLLGITLLGLTLSGCQLLPTQEAEAPPQSVPLERQSGSVPARPPAAPVQRKAKAKPAPAKKAPTTACGVELSDSRQALAAKYYLKGDRLFTKDDIKKAKKALQTAVCLDPNNAQAKQLLDSLNSVYPGL